MREVAIALLLAAVLIRPADAGQLVATADGLLGAVIVAGLVGGMLGFCVGVMCCAWPRRRPPVEFRGEQVE